MILTNFKRNPNDNWFYHRDIGNNTRNIMFTENGWEFIYFDERFEDKF